MAWGIIIMVVYLFFIIYVRHRISKRNSVAEKYDPFNRYKLVCLIEREDASTIERPHKRFEYIGQTVEDGEIIGIYTYYEKSKKELKYEELLKKWR